MNDEKFDSIRDALLSPDSYDAATIGGLIVFAQKHIGALTSEIADVRNVAADVLMLDDDGGAGKREIIARCELEIAKFKNAIERLEPLRDSKAAQEKLDAAEDARAEATAEREKALAALMKFAPELEKMGVAWADFQSANSAADKAHDQFAKIGREIHGIMHTTEPLIESGNHTGIDRAFGDQITSTAKAMSEAIANRAELDAKAKQYRDDAPRRAHREHQERLAAKAAFEVGDAAYFQGFSLTQIQTAQGVARAAVFGGKTIEEAIQIGRESLKVTAEIAA